MRHFIREFTAAARSPLPYIIWAVLTVVLTVSGPFDTYAQLSKPERAVYWAAVVAISIVIGKAVRILVAHHAGRLHFALRQVLIACGIAGVLGPSIWFMSRGMIGPSVPGLPVFLYFVFVAAAGVQVIRQVMALTLHPLPLPAAAAEPEPVPGPRLLNRIEPELRGEILRLSARNHYLEVQTDKGQANLLLRFFDGLAEVDGLDGAQVHRSHWVAWRAVAGAGQAGNRLFLQMADGTQVPVSRRKEALLVERGLL